MHIAYHTSPALRAALERTAHVSTLAFGLGVSVACTSADVANIFESAMDK